MTLSDGLPRLFTPAEVAEAIGQTQRYVTEKCRLREWPHRRFARGQIRFSPDDYEHVLALASVQVTAAESSRLALAPRSPRRRAS